MKSTILEKGARHLAALILCVGGTISAHAGVIATFTDNLSGVNYSDPLVTWQVQITSTLFDNFRGDYSKDEWRYTLTNINYDLVYPPLAPQPNGLSVFNVLLPGVPVSALGNSAFADFYCPDGWISLSRGWVGDFDYVFQPVFWGQWGSADIPIGGSADFGFSLPKSFVIAQADTYLGTIIKYYGPNIGIIGTVTAPLVTPEASTPILVAGGLALLVVLRRVFRRALEV